MTGEGGTAPRAFFFVLANCIERGPSKGSGPAQAQERMSSPRSYWILGFGIQLAAAIAVRFPLAGLRWTAQCHAEIDALF